MNNGRWLFLGILLAFASSFLGFVVAPQRQLGQQVARATEDFGRFYPPPRPELARQGAEVYRSLGCVECHTRQVRGQGSDLARGWGKRISVAQDYLWDYPVSLGSQRLGPDLANLGVRRTNALWHLEHLYDPGRVTTNSPMPRFPFLFEPVVTRSNRLASLDPLTLDVEADGKQLRLLPGSEGRSLVAFLMSLQAEAPLFEAPAVLTAGNPTNTVGTSASPP
jgi:cytochrome c oxidase cbb3-type subunit II